jgi:hypothetical protein
MAKKPQTCPLRYVEDFLDVSNERCSQTIKMRSRKSFFTTLLGPHRFPPHLRRARREPRAWLAYDLRGKSCGTLSRFFDRATERESTKKDSGESVAGAG